MPILTIISPKSESYSKCVSSKGLHFIMSTSVMAWINKVHIPQVASAQVACPVFFSNRHMQTVFHSKKPKTPPMCWFKQKIWTSRYIYIVQWNRAKDTLGPTIESIVEKLSSSQRSQNVYYYDGNSYFWDITKCPLWEVVPFSEGPLSEVPLYLVYVCTFRLLFCKVNCN